MFPYPSGAGLHVGHPLGYIATDVVGRYRRMRGDNVLHALGYDAFGLPAEIHAVQTGEHPRTNTESNIANMRRQLRRLGLAHDPRRSFATIDPDFMRWTQWIFVQIFESWYDEEQGRAQADQRAACRLRVRCPHGSRRNGVGRPDADRAQRPDRRGPSGVRRRVAGQLVPGPRHGAGQRGGHRRRAQRARQLPGLHPQPAPVEDADHRLLRPPDRRPRPHGLARVGQEHAAQLDRPLARRADQLPGR